MITDFADLFPVPGSSETEQPSAEVEPEEEYGEIKTNRF